MRLGGTVCCASPAEWETKLIESGFRAVTAPFTCETPREEIRRLCGITEKHGVAIAEVGVWRNPFDRKQGAANLDYAVCQLRLADELGIPCCVNIAGTDSAAGWDAADRGNFTEEMYRRLISSVRAVISAFTEAICCCRLSACCFRRASSTRFSERACITRPFQRRVTMTCVSAHTVTSAAAAMMPRISRVLSPSIRRI